MRILAIMLLTAFALVSCETYESNYYPGPDHGHRHHPKPKPKPKHHKPKHHRQQHNTPRTHGPGGYHH